MNVKLLCSARLWLIVLIAAIAGVPSVSARDFTYTYEGQTLIYTVIDETAKTCMTKAGFFSDYPPRPGNSVSGDLTIPSIAKYGNVEYSVTGLGDLAFDDCRGLTSVIIPNSVTSIGDFAFQCCSGLTSVTIPKSVTYIGQSAFSNCSGLASVSIGKSVTTIGDHAFSNCSGLTSVTIPNSVTEIGYGAFSYCIGLTTVSIPNSVIKIGHWAFSNCSGLTSVTVGNSVSEIGEFVFSGCSGLTNINVAADNTSYSSIDGILYNKDAFVLISCPGAKVSVNIPNSVIEICGGAFSDCSGLTSVTIPNSVTYIGRYAFSGCSGLTSVIIPNSVTHIRQGSFAGCCGLTTVTFPNSLTNIDEAAFAACSGLTSVTIPNSVTSIGNRSFFNCSGLTSVTIPNSVRSISYEAFGSCEKLAEVNYNTTEPIKENRFIFDPNTYYSATLNVAIGGLAEASSTEPWKYFANIKEKDFSGVEGVIAEIDPNVPVEVFDLNGVRVSDSVDNIAAGIYIVRKGAKEHKIMVK